MPAQILVSPAEVALHLSDPRWLMVDCRFALADPTQGRRDYLAEHIPGAIYAHLDHDLSAPVIPGVTGRHPLPTPQAAAAVFSRLGIGPEVQVVAYDDQAGALGAARLWWMLRWLGHPAAAVLDGGWLSWLNFGLPTRAGEETRPAATFTPQPRPELLLTAAEVDQRRLDPAWRVIDVRGRERFRGEVEPVDPVAGHIPGAHNLPYCENADAAGNFLPPEVLAAQFQPVLGTTPAAQTVFYCGSGVSAAQGILALMYAGLGEARLYPGSWSEWITDPDRPVATGAG